MIQDVLKSLHLNASPHQVWEALTDPAKLAMWFPDETDLRPEAGAEGVFHWENHGKYAVRLEEIMPETRLVWSWARTPDVPLTETHRTRIEWSLEASGNGGTILNLRESGFISEEDRAGNDGGWDKELGELVEWLTAGAKVRAGA